MQNSAVLLPSGCSSCCIVCRIVVHNCRLNSVLCTDGRPVGYGWVHTRHRQERHSATLPLEHCRLVISKTTHFRCNTVDDRCSIEWDSITVLGFRAPIHFLRRYEPKLFFTFPPPPNNLNLSPFDLEIAPPVTRDVGNLTNLLSLNVVWFYVFEFTVNGGHRTDRRVKPGTH